MSPRDFDDDALTDEPSGPSKTQVKKAMHELQALGQTLMELPISVLDNLNLEPSLREALDNQRRMKSYEARRRQAQLIGKLMRTLDTTPIRQGLERYRLGVARATARPPQDTETSVWCTRLLDDPASLTDWVRNHPDVDAQQLRRLLRAARAASSTAQEAADDTAAAAAGARDRALDALQRFVAAALKA